MLYSEMRKVITISHPPILTPFPEGSRAKMVVPPQAGRGVAGLTDVQMSRFIMIGRGKGMGLDSRRKSLLTDRCAVFRCTVGVQSDNVFPWLVAVLDKPLDDNVEQKYRLSRRILSFPKFSPPPLRGHPPFPSPPHSWLLARFRN